MSPKSVSVALLLLWLVLSVVVRMGLHRRATGSSGVTRFSARPGSVEWTGGVLFVVSLLTCGVGVCVAPASNWSVTSVVGVAIAMVGVVGTFMSQSSMGSSWRIGVDPSERTVLRTDGLFRLVRNPIFTAMALTLVGFAVVSSHWLVIVGVLLFVLSIEMQVRFVEEPYLAMAHGEAFASYASNVGRFIPRVGLCRPTYLANRTSAMTHDAT